jgi:hypothetical protein
MGVWGWNCIYQGKGMGALEHGQDMGLDEDGGSELDLNEGHHALFPIFPAVSGKFGIFLARCIVCILWTPVVVSFFTSCGSERKFWVMGG